MKLSELQIISYLHRHTVSHGMLERWRPWIIYLYLSYINHLHTQALSDRLLSTTDAGLQATFSCVFQSIS